MYWAHLPHQTDICSEGYVGVTSDTAKRIREHLSKAKRGHHGCFSNALRKHGGALVWDIVLIGSREYVLSIEKALRPTAGIGWNTIVGGVATPIREFNISTSSRLSQGLNDFYAKTHWVDRLKSEKLSSSVFALYELLSQQPDLPITEAAVLLGVDYTSGFAGLASKVKREIENPSEEFLERLMMCRQSVSLNTEAHREVLAKKKDSLAKRWEKSAKARLGKPVSEATRQKLKDIRSRGWEHYNACKHTWLLAEDIYKLCSENLGYKAIATKLSLKYTGVLSIYKRIKSGWNPSEDEDYLFWRLNHLNDT